MHLLNRMMFKSLRIKKIESLENSIKSKSKKVNELYLIIRLTIKHVYIYYNL